MAKKTSQPLIRQVIAVITSSRADYVPLRPLLHALKDDLKFSLKLIASGGHLSKIQGETLKDIQDDGFIIDWQVSLQTEGRSRLDTARALGSGIASFAEAYDVLRPDLIIVLGDRFEIFAAATAATMLNLPIAHLCGGDLTEGAIDDIIRHAVTKMAHLHLVSNETSAARICQMGESPQRVFTVGTPALDDLRSCAFFDHAELNALLKFQLREKNILTTFHPVTKEPDNGLAGLQSLLNILESFSDDTGIIFTSPNVDSGGAEFVRLITDFALAKDNRVFKANLGSTGYFSLLRFVDVIVGNSSSGLTEAPSLGTPTVNIGDRQRGRIQCSSVVSCAPTEAAIGAAITRALRLECPQAKDNPYGDGYASDRIVSVLKSVGDFGELIQKSFHDLKISSA